MSRNIEIAVQPHGARILVHRWAIVLFLFREFGFDLARIRLFTVLKPLRQAKFTMLLNLLKRIKARQLLPTEIGQAESFCCPLKERLIEVCVFEDGGGVRFHGAAAIAKHALVIATATSLLDLNPLRVVPGEEKSVDL